MNIKQEGLGLCGRCGTPIMQAVNQPGIKGLCFGCMADGQPKTGHTSVVVGETGEGLLGKVELQEVEHMVGPASNPIKDADAVRKAIADKAKGQGAVLPAQSHPSTTGSLVITTSIEELLDAGIVHTLLLATYNAIDNMPPCATLRETKKAIKLQERIEVLLKKEEK